MTESNDQPSVIIPSVPSAPMNSFVVSNPADDLRDRRRVLITSPDGSTTVCRVGRHVLIRVMYEGAEAKT